MRIRLNYLTPVLAAGAAAVAIAAAPTAAADPTPAQPGAIAHVVPAGHGGGGHGGGGGGHGGWAATAAGGAAVTEVGAAVTAVGAAIAVGAGADTGSGQSRRKRPNQREDPCPASWQPRSLSAMVQGTCVVVSPK